MPTGPLAQNPSSAASSNQVKVLFLVDSLVGGGTQQAIYNYLRHMNPSRVQARVISITASGDAFSNRMREFARVEFVKDRPNSIWTFLSLKTWSEIGRLIEEFEPDVLHARLDGALVFGSLLCRAKKIPHFFFTIEASGCQGSYFGLRALAYWIFLMNASRIFTNYPEEYRSMGLPEDRRKEYSTSVDVDETAGRPGCILSEDEFRKHSPILVSAGRLHPDKGHQYAIRLMSLIRPTMPTAHLYVCGEGEYRRDLEDLVAREGLEKYVTFTGYLSEIDWVLKRADLFLALMTNEPLNQSAARAMKWGLPVMAFRTGLSAHIGIREGINGCELPLRDLASAPDRIRYLLDHADRSAIQASMFLPSGSELAGQYDDFYFEHRTHPYARK